MKRRIKKMIGLAVAITWLCISLAGCGDKTMALYPVTGQQEGVSLQNVAEHTLVTGQDQNSQSETRQKETEWGEVSVIPEPEEKETSDGDREHDGRDPSGHGSEDHVAGSTMPKAPADEDILPEDPVAPPASSGSGDGESGTSEHIHTWVEQGHTEHHEAEGYYEKVWVETKAAWDEPIYGTQEVTRCSTCGIVLAPGTAVQHLEETEHGGYYGDVERVQTGTKHHEAEGYYQDQWVETRTAWDEYVSDGFRCPGCGAVK